MIRPPHPALHRLYRLAAAPGAAMTRLRAVDAALGRLLADAEGLELCRDDRFAAFTAGPGVSGRLAEPVARLPVPPSPEPAPGPETPPRPAGRSAGPNNAPDGVAGGPASRHRGPRALPLDAGGRARIRDMLADHAATAERRNAGDAGAGRAVVGGSGSIGRAGAAGPVALAAAVARAERRDPAGPAAEPGTAPGAESGREAGTAPGRRSEIRLPDAAAARPRRAARQAGGGVFAGSPASGEPAAVRLAGAVARAERRGHDGGPAAGEDRSIGAVSPPASREPGDRDGSGTDPGSPAPGRPGALPPDAAAARLRRAARRAGGESVLHQAMIGRPAGAAPREAIAGVRSGIAVPESPAATSPGAAAAAGPVAARFDAVLSRIGQTRREARSAGTVPDATAAARPERASFAPESGATRPDRLPPAGPDIAIEPARGGLRGLAERAARLAPGGPPPVAATVVPPRGAVPGRPGSPADSPAGTGDLARQIAEILRREALRHGIDPGEGVP